MRILFLSDDFPPQSFGGAGISTYEMAKGVLDLGHEVFVITAGRTGGETEYDGLKVFNIDCQYHERWRAYLSLYNPKAIRKIEKILKEVKPDIVHANNVHFYLSYHSLKISRRYAKGVVITLRDAMSFSFGKLKTKKYLENFDAHLSWFDQLRQAKKRWNPLRNFIIKRYLRYADKIFAVSEALKHALEQNGIRGAEVMHTGIDISRYPISNPSSESQQTILFGGRLSEAKGSELVKDLMKKIPQAKLLAAGDKNWLNREDMKKAYADSSIVLVPSICFDAFPRAVIEGMAAGKPVVGTCYGGASEAIVDDITGFVVNPFNAEDMALKVKSLLSSGEKRLEMGRAARRRIETNFNLSDKIDKLVSTYEGLH